MTIDPEILDKLRTQYGEIFVASPGADSETEVVFRRASRADVRGYKSDKDHDTYKFVADERLDEACVIYPDRMGFQAVLDKYPFFAGPLAGQIMLASGGGEASAKKA
jgi:hypothetical protein